MSDDARKVKVFRLEVMVVDHDELGERGVARELENVNFPNDCMSPEVASSEFREVEWTDESPLNRSDPAVWVSAFRELFPCRACSIEAAIGTEDQPHPVPERFHTCKIDESLRQPPTGAPLTRELVTNASLGVIPTMRLVASHLRNDDMVQAGEVNKIYAEKLTREAESLEQYCQQLAVDLTDALAAIDKLPAIDAALKTIRYVRDTLAGTPPRVKS